jgi:hypothetical protein
MDNQQRAVEAVKLLKDWSAWMVASELAVIAFLGSSYASKGAVLGQCITGVLVSFVVSIAAAAWLLGALPWIVVNLDNPEFQNPYQARLSSAPGFNRVRVWMLGFVQHACFFLGIVFLAAGVLYA